MNIAEKTDLQKTFSGISCVSIQ